MYYFIPAWYGKERPWLPIWYLGIFHFKLEFDDTFNQIRLTQRQGIPAQVLLLSYQPHLRYFLHRQGILEAPVYSLFDELQDFHEIRPQVLQVRDIEWEEDCGEFVYSPFTILVLRNGKPYAQVEHGIEGFISTIQYFKEDRLLSANYLMDDRGLVQWFTTKRTGFTKTTNPKGLCSLESTCKMIAVSRSILSLLFASKKEATKIWENWLLNFEKKILNSPEEGATYFLPACDQHNAFL